MMHRQQRLWRTAGLFLTLGFLVYGASLGNGFVSWDDNSLIVNNPLLRSLNLQTLRYAFTSFDPELYIPLTFVSYQMDVLLSGGAPAFFHLTNLLLHIASAFLVGRILGILLDDERWGIVGGLLFLVHPINTEAVVWASARKDVLSGFFALLAVERYLAFVVTNRPRSLRISQAAFLLGLLAKVTIAPIALLLPLLRWALHRSIDRRALLRELLPFLLAAVLLGIVALIGKRAVDSPLTLVQTVLLSAKTIAVTLGHIVLPIGLAPIYAQGMTVRLTQPDILLSLLCIAALAGGIILLRKERLALLAAAWFSLLFLPACTTFSKAGYLNLTSDRYVYLAGIGVLLILLVLAKRIIGSVDRTVGTVVALILAGLGVLSARQSLVWHDSLSLFRHAVAMQPASVAAQNNLGVALNAARRTDEAEAAFKAAIAIQPYSKAWINLGTLERDRGNVAAALEDFSQAAAVDPRDPDPFFARGGLLADQGRDDEAIVAFRAVLDRDPNYSPATNNLAALLLKHGDAEQAATLLHDLLLRNPYYTDAHFNYALALQTLGRTDGAIVEYRAALQAQPALFDALSRIVPLLLDAGQREDAIALLRNALETDPSDADAAHLALATAKTILGIDAQNLAARHLVEWMLATGIVQAK